MLCHQMHCRPSGSEALPKGIVNETSNFEMQRLWRSSDQKIQEYSWKKNNEFFSTALHVHTMFTYDYLVQIGANSSKKFVGHCSWCKTKRCWQDCQKGQGSCAVVIEHWAALCSTNNAEYLFYVLLHFLLSVFISRWV